MLREKQFYKTFSVLALSLALHNLLSYSVNMMDMVMLGRYSQNAMSGVSLCNQVQFMLQMLVEGAGEGAVVLGAQYWGKNRLEPIPHIIGAAMRFGGGMAVVMFLIVRLVPEQLLNLLSNDPLVIAEGVRYFQIVSWTYILFTVTNILVASLRSVGIVSIGYVISFSTLCINICLNYLLIYGNCGFPELGVQGAAVATLVSRCIELLIVILYLKFREKQLCLTLKKLVCMDTSYLRDYIRVSLPVLLNQAQWGAAQMVQTGILGHLGGDVTAANAIAVQAYQVLSVVAYGASSASRYCGGQDHRCRRPGSIEASGSHTGGAVLRHWPSHGPYHLPAAQAAADRIRRYSDRKCLPLVHAVHDCDRRHHRGNLLSGGLRQRHHPGRRRYRLQRQDEPHQHVAHHRAPVGSGGLPLGAGAGGGVLSAEMGPAL